MEFFDKKEEVLDIQLTQYGRHLLSKGKFKPEFYAFFDDNILYNTELAGHSEIQNESSKRIKETPTMHPQISLSSLSENFKVAYNKILSGKVKAGDQSLQPSPEKNHLLTKALGTSSPNSDFMPAWHVRFLNGHLSGSNKNLVIEEKSDGKQILNIPQIDSDMTFDVAAVDEADVEDALSFDDGDQSGITPNSTFIVTSEPEKMYTLLKVEEKNGKYQKENFDIEIFEIEEKDEGGKIVEFLRPLYFPHSDPLSEELDFLDEDEPDVTIEKVGYYFDISVDDEIEDEVICQHDFESKKQGVFADTETKICEDILNEEGKKVFDIYSDESDTPDEVC
jgi:hypothetical protein